MQIDKFTFGMRGHDLGKSLEEMCRNAKKFNITRLQFAPAITMKDIDFDVTGYDEAVAERMVTTLNSYDLRVSVLGCYIDPITAETLEARLTRFENFIRYAKAVDATVIGTETGKLDTVEATHSDRTFAKFVKSMERLLPIAEGYGVNIGIEPVWGNTVYSVQRMNQLLDYFNSDNLNVIFDPINILNRDNCLHQNEVIDSAVEVLGDKIKSLHLKDYVIENDRLRRVPVGTGQFDVSYCLERIGELKTVPDVMLDEMPLADLDGVRERLEEIRLKEL